MFCYSKSQTSEQAQCIIAHKVVTPPSTGLVHRKACFFPFNFPKAYIWHSYIAEQSILHLAVQASLVVLNPNSVFYIETYFFKIKYKNWLLRLI